MTDNVPLLPNQASPRTGQDVVALPDARPWPRYWAKTLDLTLLVFVLEVLLLFGFPTVAALSANHEVLLTLCLIPVAVLGESVLYAIFGSTPGKWLLGLRVLSTEGRQLPFSSILRRNFGVYWSGLGLGIPLITLITLLRAHSKAKQGQVQSWDIDTASRCYATVASPARTGIGAVIAICLILGIRALGAYAGTPRGALEVAALTVNAKAPQQIDEATRLDGAVASENRFQYLFTLTKYDPAVPGAAGDSARRRSTQFIRVHDVVCKSEDMKPFREIGATVQYTYRDGHGGTVWDIVITPKDCLTNGSILAVAADVNSSAPVDLDADTRLDGAVASGNTIQYLYTLTTYDAAHVDQKALDKGKRELTVRLKDRACTHADFRWLRDAGGAVKFTYRDRSGATVLEAVVLPEQCK